MSKEMEFFIVLIAVLITVVISILVVIFLLDFGPYWNHRLYQKYYDLKWWIADKLVYHYSDRRLSNFRKAEREKRFLKSHLPYRPRYIQKYYDFLELLEKNEMVEK